MYSSNSDSEMFTDLDFPELCPIDDNDSPFFHVDLPAPLECLTPNEQSSCSSDYEDVFSISDGFLSEILEDKAEETNTIGFSDLDWLTERSVCNDNTKKNYSSIKEKPSEPMQKHTKNPFEYLQSVKLWSKMSPVEQLQTLHALSEIVTFHMGIGEQMEIIKILDPTAIISAEDTEFALDSSFLTDLKLRRIKGFIKQQYNVIQRTPTKSIVSSRKAPNSSKLWSRKSNTSYSRTKRRQKKNTNILSGDINLKLQKQNRKEERSGFFVYEKKMKIVKEEEEDVNILE